MQPDTKPEPAALDLIWGAANIAAVIGTDVRATFYMLDKKLIPATKIGKAWVASRSALVDHFGAALARPPQG